MQSATNTSGFTLVESIIYIGLFSILFTGIFITIHPLFVGAERLTRNIAGEGETAFILAKIDYALGATMTDAQGVIVSPAAGETADELVLEYASEERFRFVKNETNEYCTAPLLCHTLTLSNTEGDALPLNTQRVHIENFSVTHTGPIGDASRYIDVSFSVNGEPIGPIRYYLHF